MHLIYFVQLVCQIKISRFKEYKMSSRIKKNIKLQICFISMLCVNMIFGTMNLYGKFHLINYH